MILADAGVPAQVWRILTSPGGAEAVAAIIRSWEGEEPRALWERLRAEGWGDLTEPGEVAAWSTLGAWAYPASRDGSNDGEFFHHPCGQGGAQVQARTIASRVAACARWLSVGSNAHRQGEPASGYVGEGAHGGAGPNATATATAGNVISAVPCQVYSDARAIPIPADCDGVYVYLDPPYHGDGKSKITGYAHDLPRADVLDLARRWSEAGATVAISEAVPLADDLGDGWEAINIQGERVGRKRTFARVTSEWLTLNRQPAYRPVAGQVALFGGLTPDEGAK